MDKKMTASGINKQLKRVAERFGYHQGNYAKTRQEYSQILRPAGLVKGGTGLVMSYEEAKRRMEKAKEGSGIEVVFTKEQYKAEVERFYQEQKEHLYIKSEMKLQRERAERIVEDAFKREGKEVPDLSKYTFEQLRDAIREANVQYSDKNVDKTDSPRFYERVIQNLMGNGDAETE